jgi:hypothetical protein
MLYSVGASLSMPWGSGVTGSADTRGVTGTGRSGPRHARDVRNADHLPDRAIQV